MNESKIKANNMNSKSSEKEINNIEKTNCREEIKVSDNEINEEIEERLEKNWKMETIQDNEIESSKDVSEEIKMNVKNNSKYDLNNTRQAKNTTLNQVTSEENKGSIGVRIDKRIDTEDQNLVTDSEAVFKDKCIIDDNECTVN